MIGSGVAGLTAAYVLNRQDDVTLFEADSRLGGHAHTHDMPQPDGSLIGVDTGFIVHNERTYPTLLRLFAELGRRNPGLRDEHVHPLRRLRPRVRRCPRRSQRHHCPPRPACCRGRYLRMLLEVTRFYRKARILLKTAPASAVGAGTQFPN